MDLEFFGDRQPYALVHTEIFDKMIIGKADCWGNK